MKPTLKGFTLLEMLTVIAVMGILFALSLGPIRTAHERGRDTNRKAHLQLIAEAIDLYYADNRQYPTGGSCPQFTSNQVVGGSTTTSWITGLDPYVSASQDKTLPRDPYFNTPQGATYRYEYYSGQSCLGNVPGGFTLTSGISYVLVAYLENSNDIEAKTVNGRKVYRIVR